ncbi:PAS domain-containing sensor histidine kinase [Leptospira langatensis]|uniref:histidine kinase n=1 Tax=Leptospira langatensis TaxID=2484983 RepID=A0A5F1ZUE9_9LEPT|nr:PAS domain-containing sensor histidine kinase [Leptospira langatensis]TGK00295.1 PAS domain-containing sensor histidine kinase [Leptospira langatensis]TGL41069.1 PAS domain-containing sensor histidine kinase [Leptospira langatensis]
MSQIDNKNVYRALFEQSPIGLMIFDQNGTIVEANESSLHFLKATKERIIGLSYQDLKDKTVSELLGKGLKGEASDYEGPYRTTISNIILQVRFRVNPLMEKGKLVGIALIFENLTERMETEARLANSLSEKLAVEAALKENEVKFKTLFHSAGEAIFLMDDRIFLECNPKTEEMFGCDREDIVGASPVDFSPEYQPDGSASSEKAKQKIMAALDGRPQTFDWLHCKKDRSTFDAEVTLTSVTLNGRKLLQAIVRDISERKKAEEQIKKLNEDLEQKVVLRTEELKATNTYLENTNRNLIVTLDELKSTQAQLIQSEKMAVLGQLIAGIAHEVNTPLGAIISSNEGIQSLFRQDWEKLLCDFAEMSPSERESWKMIFSKGSIFPEFYDSAEERKNRKLIREALHRLGYPSLEFVSENLAELGIRPEDLPELVKEVPKEKFSTVVSNASSLSGIIRHSNVIREAAIKASRVIRALKTYVYQDQTVLSIIDIREQMDTVLTLYYNKLKYGVEIVRKFSDRSVVRGQADQLTQVWANLINNAFQAIAYQGVLELGSYTEGDFIVVSVTDNGPGIPEEIQDKIFEPFFTTKEKGEGSGLGLDICRKIVEMHNGRIEFDSKPGKTTFRVYLPLAETSLI